MKPTALLAFVFFFLLFAFTTTADEIVYDSDGNMMKNGGKYYLSPLETYGGGVISPFAIRLEGSDTCYLAVVQALDPHKWATTISSPSKADFISTILPLNISFAHFPPNVCTKSSNWAIVVARNNENILLWEPVMVGNDEDFGTAILNGWFYIKPYDSDKKYYKLVFCFKNNQDADVCQNIGVHVDKEKHKRLAATDEEEPLVFKFDKVKDRFASDLSMVVS